MTRRGECWSAASPSSAALTEGLEDALSGRGRLFLLVGEPGIGKSRLAEELIARSRARGARVLVGRCWEAGGALAYWPWVQSMRAYVRAAEAKTLRAELGTGAAELAQLLPELRELFPDLGEPPALESESARFRLFEAAVGFLTAASRARPIVLVLDDLHAADEPSLLLLRFLARDLGSSRLLVVGAYRDVDPTPSSPLTAAVTELSREQGTRTLVLGGLGKDDVARFIELVSGEVPGDVLVAAIYEETEGNPLFVGEIVRLLAEEGGFKREEPRRLTIPQSVRDVIARRLGHLSEECNRVLVLASVLGREFPVGVLSGVAELTEDELLETLEEAMEARVVSDVPGSLGRLRFAHVLIRDTLYEGLTTARRVRLHRLVGETLEARPGSDVAELAHHAIAGSDFDRGLLYARRAGDHALELLAYEEAVRLYATALEALELAAPADEQTRCDLLLLLGEAESRAGNERLAKDVFLEAASIARTLGLSHELARAAVGYGGRVVWVRAVDDPRLVPLLEEGVAVLGDSDVELRIKLLSRLSGALRDEPSRARRDSLSAEAVDLARRAGNIVLLAYALDGREHAIMAPDTVEECLALGAELREFAKQSDDRERIVSAHMLRIHAQLVAGDMAEAERDLAAAIVVAEELRQPAQLWQVHASGSLVALAAGRFGEVEELLARILPLGEASVPGAAISHERLQRWSLADLRGGLEATEPGIRELAVAYPGRPVFRCTLLHIHSRLGRVAEARRAFEELTADRCSSLPFDQEWLFGMRLLAETCVRLGGTDTAPMLYELLLPWRALNAVDPAEGFGGSVSRYLGQLAGLLGRNDDAAHHFEDALTMNERMGARPWLAYTQDDYARLLLARDGPDDREKAELLASRAHETYKQLGMQAIS